MTTCNCYILLYTVFVWTSMDKKTNNQHQSTYQKKTYMKQIRKKKTTWQHVIVIYCYIQYLCEHLWTKKKPNNQHQSTYQKKTIHEANQKKKQTTWQHVIVIYCYIQYLCEHLWTKKQTININQHTTKKKKNIHEANSKKSNQHDNM